MYLQKESLSTSEIEKDHFNQNIYAKLGDYTSSKAVVPICHSGEHREREMVSFSGKAWITINYYLTLNYF